MIAPGRFEAIEVPRHFNRDFQMPHKLSKNKSIKYVDTVAREQYR